MKNEREVKKVVDFNTFLWKYSIHLMELAVQGNGRSMNNGGACTAARSAIPLL